MAKTEISLAQAKRIAGRVGARIRVESSPELPDQYVVTITGRSFKDLDGAERQMIWWTESPLEAAHTAVIQTGTYAQKLYELCKHTYVNEDVLFRHWGESVERPLAGSAMRPTEEGRK